MSIDVAELLGAVTDANQKLAKNSAAVEELTQQQKQAAADMESAVAAAAGNNKIVVQAEQLARQDTERRVGKFVTDLGGNPDAANEVLTSVAQEWRAATINAQEKVKTLEEDLSVSFWKDPIKYIGAQINMENTIQQADVAVKRRDLAHQSLTQVQQLTQSSVAEFKALEKTVTDATMEARLDNVDQELQAKRAEIRIQNAGVQINSLRDLNSMTAQQINNLQTGVNAKRQAEQDKMQRQDFEMRRKEFALRLEEHQQRLADKKATREDLANITNWVKEGAGSLGIDLTDMPESKIIQLINMKDSKFMTYLQAGVHKTGTGKPGISENAGEAARTIFETNAPLRPEQAPIKKMLTGILQYASTAEAGAAGRYDNTKKDQVNAGATVIANQKAAEMAKNIDHTDRTNIYAPPSIKAVAQVPAIANSPWFKTVMKDQVDAGGLDDFNSQQLITMTSSAVKAGKISFKDATEGLQAAHRAAMMVNNATKNYSGFGLPEQTTFNLTIPNAIGVPKKYDMVTAQDIQRALSSKMNEDRSVRPWGETPFGFR